MRHFNDILVLVPDGGDVDSVIATASRLARVNHAKLTLLDVLDEFPAEMYGLVTPDHLRDLKELTEHERCMRLERMAEPLREEGLSVDIHFTWGRPAVETVREVIGRRHDAVIAAAERKSGIGLTPMRLIRKCPTPVWVVNTTVHHPPFRVLAAVDPTSGNGESPTLNHKILTSAKSFADLTGGEVFVVHAWESLGYDKLGQGKGNADVKRFITETETRHRDDLTALLKSTLRHLPREHVILREGPAADVIVDVVRRSGIDLLVLGTLRSCDTEGLLIGRTAEAVMHDLPCSMVALKPDEFVSPMVGYQETKFGQEG